MASKISRRTRGSPRAQSSIRNPRHTIAAFASIAMANRKATTRQAGCRFFD
jgi:hypothetical protein